MKNAPVSIMFSESISLMAMAKKRKVRARMIMAEHFDWSSQKPSVSVTSMKSSLGGKKCKKG